MNRILIMFGLLSTLGLIGACDPGPTPQTEEIVAAPVEDDRSDAGAEEEQEAAIPDSEIYLARIQWTDDGMELTDLQNITQRPGYDNQPFFHPDGRSLLYTVMADDGQADIFAFSLPSGPHRRVTRTKESEFSPTPLDNGRFSSVRVELDTDKTQRLWTFGMNGNDAHVVLPDITGVGYHAWIDPVTVALFVVDDPPLLKIADTMSGEARVGAKNIGRSLHKIPGHQALSFVDKTDPDQYWIKKLDGETGEISPLVATRKGHEDHVWIDDSQVLMAEGDKIYLWPGHGEQWRVAADLAGQVDGVISRLALSPNGDYLALVATQEEAR